MSIPHGWKNRVASWVLLAVASGGVLAQPAPLDSRNGTDPHDRPLDGVWQCYFLKASGAREQTYYSVWTFEAAKHWVHIFWSPVHKGLVNGYAWDGKQLVLGDPANPLQHTLSTLNAQLQGDGTLMIDDPRLRWQGWRCHPQPQVHWPHDGLQFLDYARYPWLSGLVEDGREIERYRQAKP